MNEADGRGGSEQRPSSGPTMSVLITNYNYKQYVGSAIDQVLRQTVQPTDVIVIDDGSTDGSYNVLCERYAQRETVRLIFSQNCGQLGAFRSGLKHCTGDVVCLLDADDLWDDQYLSVIQGVYNADPSIDFVFTNMRYVGNRDGESENRQLNRDIGITALLVAFTARYICTASSAVSLKRDMLSRILDIPAEFDREWMTCADSVIAIGSSILGAHKYYIGEPLVNYRVHDANNWFGRRRARLHQIHHALRTIRIASLFRDRSGINQSSLEWAHLEFKTRQQPNASDLFDYLRLQLLGFDSLSHKLWAIASMLKHYGSSVVSRISH